ncbi:hypothetical protein LRE75_26065 [Streptomyces sp. 372A]
MGQQLMDSFRGWWVEGGKIRVSAVSYDVSSAEGRQRQLEGQGATDVEIISAKLGEALTFSIYSKGSRDELTHHGAGKPMSVKKHLQETPHGQLVMLLAELVSQAENLAFEKKENGSMHAAATFKGQRVEVEWGGPTGFSLRIPPVKTIPGEVEAKPRRKPSTKS